MEEVLSLINIGPTNPIQILNQHEIFWKDFFWKILYVSFKWYFEKK